MARGSFLVFFVFLLVLGPRELHSQSTSDASLFRHLYDAIADLFTGGPQADGTFTQVFLMEVPGITIRREDFDPSVWAANDFVDPMPSANFAQLVDRIPRYVGLTFSDSGFRISQMWDILLRLYVVPRGLDPSSAVQISLARAKLANDTLLNQVEDLSNSYSEALEASLSARESCLSLRQPSTCSQLATTWRDTVRRRWYQLTTVKSELESAQSAIINANLRDFNTLFTRALEKTEAQKRIDVGSLSYGNEFYNTFATPSNWWTWFPFDASAYDFVLDNRFSDQAFYGIDGVTEVTIQPRFGSLFFNGTYLAYYPPTTSYVGPDFFSFRQGGLTVDKSVLINGNTFSEDGGAQWTKVSLDESSLVETSQSAYSVLHSQSSATLASGAISFRGSLTSSTVNTAASYQFTSGSFKIEFEVARVQISRPWLDLSLMALNGIGVKGFRQAGWSTGSSIFSPTAQQLFSLLPTQMVIGRNIKLSSDQITSFSSLISGVTAGSFDASVQIGPFSVGRTTSGASGNFGFSSGRMNSDNSLSIDGPQIIGWICAPLPEFPTADWATIQQLNDLEAVRYFESQVLLGLINNGAVSLPDAIVQDLFVNTTRSTASSNSSATNSTAN